VYAADGDRRKAVGSLIAAQKTYAKPAYEKGFGEPSICAFADAAVIFVGSILFFSQHRIKCPANHDA
jgi:hypothetical protein